MRARVGPISLGSTKIESQCSCLVLVFAGLCTKFVYCMRRLSVVRRLPLSAIAANTHIFFSACVSVHFRLKTIANCLVSIALCTQHYYYFSPAKFISRKIVNDNVFSSLAYLLRLLLLLLLLIWRHLALGGGWVYAIAIPFLISFKKIKETHFPLMNFPYSF